MICWRGMIFVAVLMLTTDVHGLPPDATIDAPPKLHVDMAANNMIDVPVQSSVSGSLPVDAKVAVAQPVLGKADGAFPADTFPQGMTDLNQPLEMFPGAMVNANPQSETFPGGIVDINQPVEIFSGTVMAGKPLAETLSTGIVSGNAAAEPLPGGMIDRNPPVEIFPDTVMNVQSQISEPLPIASGIGQAKPNLGVKHSGAIIDGNPLADTFPGDMAGGNPSGIPFPGGMVDRNPPMELIQDTVMNVQPQTLDPLPIDRGIGLPEAHFGGVKPSECRSLIDLMMVLDGSDSITYGDFDKLRYALAHIIPDLDLGPRRIRLGFVVYSTNIAQTEHLSFDKQYLTRAAENALHPRDGTHTDKGIKKMIEEFEKNGRKGVPWVSIIITDGISKFPEKTIQVAKLAKSKGITMFAVGIGLTDDRELQAIASSKDKVSKLSGFDKLRAELKKLTKVICPCPRLPNFPDIIVEDGPRSIGTIRHLSCKPGLQPIGRPTIKCMKNSKWQRMKFICKYCPPPRLIHGNAAIDPITIKGPLFLGDTLQYVCNSGFVSPASITTTCIEGPKGPVWTDPIGICSECGPTTEYHDMVIDDNKIFHVGAVRYYSCHTGLVPTGKIKIKCIDNKGIPKWTEPIHSCHGCPPPKKKIGQAILLPPEIVVGRKLPHDHGYVGEERFYACIDGYVQTGTIKIICRGDGYIAGWSTPEHGCTACLVEPPKRKRMDLITPGGVLVGDVRLYKCKQGYMSLGPLETICLAAKGKAGWKPPDYECVDCRKTPLVDNAKIDPLLEVYPGRGTIGLVRTYTCKPGYIQSGPIQVGCIEGIGGPTWTTAENICQICKKPPKLPNAVLDPLYGDNKVGSIRRYTCDHGYLPIENGAVIIECIGEMKGQKGIAYWGPPSHVCRGCPDPPDLPNARIIGGSNLIGKTMDYECVGGIHATGPVFITCLPTGEWSGPKHSCTACGPTEIVANAEILPGESTIGSVRHYKCKKGYINRGKLGIKCLKSGKWTKVKFICEHCLEPPDYKNAVLEPGTSFIFDVRRYTCKQGYLATGPITTTCTPPPKDKKNKDMKPGWSRPVHHCKDCGDPYIVEFAIPERGSRTIGSLQRYRCEKGFVPSGPPHSMCQPNAEWYPPEFKCIACEEAPLTHLNASIVPLISHDSFHHPLAGRKLGDVRFYKCIDGYVATGPVELVCTVGSVGEYPLPVWQRMNENYCKGCDYKPPVKNGRPVEALSHTIGSIMTYLCDSGHEPTGPAEVVCTKTGEWSPPQFQCVAACYITPSYDDAVVDVMSGNLLSEKVIFKCLLGYLLEGDPSQVCQADGSWSTRKFRCRACLGALDVPLAIPIGPLDVITLIGEARAYKCKSGYVETGPIAAICKPDLAWSAPDYRCRGCEVEPPVKNGSPLKPIENSVGTVMEYKCVSRYEPTAVPKVRCMPNGEWSIPKFRCVISCYKPPSFKDAVVNVTTGTLLKNKVVYKCKHGYRMEGDPSVVCLANGFWSERMFTCRACLGALDVPLAIPIGPLDVITLIGEARAYKCKSGYVETGPMAAICKPDLTWSAPDYRCRGCEVEPPVKNGSPLQPIENSIGSVMEYKCVSRYEPTAAPKVQCMPNGKWSIPKFRCVISCYKPPSFKDAVVNVTTGTLLKNKVVYKCKHGYRMEGDPSVVCLANGFWSERMFTCRACLGALDVPLAIPIGPLDVITLIGEARAYKCKSGYVETGPMAAICKPDLTWSAPDYRCRGCEVEPPVKNGSPLQPIENSIGSVMEYKCVSRYEPTAAPKVQCMPNGKWSIPKFRCVISCYKPPSFKDAVVNVTTGTLLKNKVVYKCKHGYLMEGDPSVVCLANGFWSERMFTCRACFGAPQLPLAIPVGPIEVITLIGEARTYRCENGYFETGPVAVICKPNLEWSKPDSRCRGCEVVPKVPHGIPIKPKLTSFRSTMRYKCVGGHEPTATPEIHCRENGEWSVPQFHCAISCYEPTAYSDATVDVITSMLVKGVATYKCLPGYLLHGKPTRVCQSNGHWSERAFSCRKCPPPPHLETALPKSTGPTEVGSLIEYRCKEGYVSPAPVISECLPTLKWSTPASDCSGCGKPPDIKHTYCSMGPSTIGSKRRYQCDPGFYMRGRAEIVCLPSGVWSKPNFRCNVVSPPVTTPPAPVPGDPSVCDHCRMLNNVGYLNHPLDCSMYTQCYYSGKGIVVIYQHCPFGLYWDQRVLSCRLAKDVDCPTERCRDHRIRSYKHSDKSKCCAYWECRNGKSVARCCGDGYSYVPNKGCVPDPNCPMRFCPYEETYPGCDRKPEHDLTVYQQHIGDGDWIRMPCPPGTAFSMLHCMCSIHTWVAPGFDCQPELHLDFDDGQVIDKSRNHLSIYTENIIPYRGAAYFNGRARMLINRFSNMAFHGHLVIKFRYKEQLRGLTAGALQALVTNGDCGEDPSIIVAKMPGYVLLGSKTGSARTFAMPVVDTEWKEVVYIHDEDNLEGRVCGARLSKSSYGPIRATHCAMQIGYGTRMANFMGLIDDLTVYTCRPPEDVFKFYY